MGAGNWIPPHEAEAQYATIDPDHIYGAYDPAEEWDDDERYFRFKDAKDNILALLPRSYTHSERWEGDHNVWAENSLAMLVTYEDDYSRLHVALVPKDEDGPLWGLACRHVAQTGPKLLAGIAAQYGPLTRRSGPWTSREYIPVSLQKKQSTN